MKTLKLSIGGARLHRPTNVVKGGGGGGGDGTLLEVLVCWSIPKRFYLQWKAFDLLYEISYIL